MSADPPAYVELHCHSAFSFGDGASTPAELAASAARLGQEALALTDHDGVWGAMEFAQACAPLGVRPIVGCELTLEPRRPGAPPSHLTLLTAEAEGWHNLCRLITAAHSGTRPVPAREPLPPSVGLARLEQLSGGLVCLSGCARHGPLARELGSPRPSSDSRRAALEAGRELERIFGAERLRVELQRPLWRRDRARNRALAELAERLGVRCVATGNVHAHARSRGPLQDALAAVGLGTTLDASEARRRGNHSAVLLSAETVTRRFADHREAVAESARLAEELRFDLNRDLGYTYPGAEDPTAPRRLAELCRARFRDRYEGTPERGEAARRLDDELALIERLGLSGFFLLHHEMLELAREVAAEVRGGEAARALLPPGRGRGSSVSSVVCYLTGLSHVDPVRAGLFPGRFLNDEITAMPDIDLDFPRDIRERLIPRVHERYGRERSALVAAFPTYRWRSAVRDIGKALGLPAGEIERVARGGDAHAVPGDAERDIAEAIGERRARAPRWRALARLVSEVHGLPRHLSQHPGGMILSTRPLTELCPVQPAAMEGRQIAQWDKDSCADAGFLKIDLLGLGMLSVVERCVCEIARSRGRHVDLSRIPLDDAETYRAIRAAETTGVFQIESRAQMQMLPRSRPDCLEDLVVQVAIVRPGPIQGGAVHPYLERRKLLRADPSYEVPYEHPSLEPVLSETLGAIVFQDQVIQVAMAMSGFAVGEAEGLRRAMSRKRSGAAVEAYRERFLAGACERGVERGVAERVFEQVRGFSGFGFPKSHAAAFALLAYQSTWLRVHYGPELLCSLLNEQPMGFYPADALVSEARRRGICVLGPDVNRSGLDCSAEGGREDGGEPAVRLGLAQVKGTRREELAAVVAERDREGPYASLSELASRAAPRSDTLRRLAWAGALAGLDPEQSEDEQASQRRGALWRAGIIRGARRSGGRRRSNPATGRGSADEGGATQLSLPLEPPPPPSLPELDEWQSITADYASTGIGLGGHPLALIRDGLDERTLTAESLERTEHGSRILLSGLVVARQRPETARGVVFLLLEDETGVANVIVSPPLYERRRLVVRTASFLTVEGRLERREGVVNVLASSLTELSRPDHSLAEVRELTPLSEAADPASRRSVRGRQGAADPAEIAASLPARQSFGRRA